MNLLLDTHMLLWAVFEPELLPERARQVIADVENNIRFFSPVGLWEAAIKKGLGRPGFAVDVRLLYRQLLSNAYTELPVTGIHAMAVGELPSIHKDPFDRLLLAQAKEEGLTLLTTDETLAKYPVSVLYFPKRQPK